jgi:hypothetical protein
MILEAKYGKTVTELCLVRLHPEDAYKTYDLLPVPFLDKEMRDLVEYRRGQLLTANEQQHENAH